MAPVYLRDKMEVYYTHLMTWKAEEKAFLFHHYGRELAEDSCICQADHLEAKRNHCNPSYSPKWKKQKQSVNVTTTKHCVHPSCSASSVNTKLTTPAFESIENLEALLGITSNSEQPFLLCQQHYQELYRKVHTPKPCACCGAKPKFGNPFLGIALMQTQCPYTLVKKQVSM